jgi:hypothetical protein
MSANPIEVGDVVRIGKGKVLWTVRAFWNEPVIGVRYADLIGVGGYSGTSAALDRLTVVTRAGVA